MSAPGARHRHRRDLVLRVGVAVLVGAVLLVPWVRSGAGGETLGEPPVDRVLIVSLPGVGWDDVRDADLPHLERFVESAAIGDLSTRIGRRKASTTDAYLTMGAGTRAVSPAVDAAVATGPDELYGGTPSDEILRRRLGFVPDGIAYLSVGAAADVNDVSPYGAEVGTLGDHLAQAGVARAVIANADAAEGFISDEPPPDGAFARSAVAALMGSNGVVPEGTVGRSLLTDDQTAAFGHRLDPDAVLAAFDEAWGGDDRIVALVEASDIGRAAAYGSAESGQRAALREEALADADALLDRLLEQVDPERDAVMVISPVSPNGAPPLGLVAVQAPGAAPGWLQSATTRRAGYVQLADVAPAVLSLLGEDRPRGIEGRAFQVDDDASGDRMDRLVDQAEAAELRDDLMAPVVTFVIVSLVLMAAVTVVRHRLRGRLAGVRRLLRPAALGVLALLPATFLVGRIEPFRSSLPGYVVGVVMLAAVIGYGVGLAERWRPGLGPIVAVGLVVAVIGIDVLVGAPLQVNTVFGYSMAVGGRFTGLGNLAFALFGAAAIVLAALMVERAGRRALWAAVALLGVVVLIDGLPMLGADVGGVVSLVPAMGVTVLILAGRRVGLPQMVALGLGTAAAVFAFALLDAIRPASEQTHLTRVVENVVDGRWGTIADTVTRRWQASFGGADLAGWVTVAVILGMVGVYTVLVATGRAGPGARRPESRRPTVAAAAGLAVLGIVGLVANDSSLAVPGLTFFVIVPVLVLRAVARDDLHSTDATMPAANGARSHVRGGVSPPRVPTTVVPT